MTDYCQDRRLREQKSGTQALRLRNDQPSVAFASKSVNSLRDQGTRTSDLAARSQSRCAAGADLQDMVEEDLLFVRTAIETYDDMVRYFETHDLATARMLASILAIHEHHAEELTALMIGLTPPLHG